MEAKGSPTSGAARQVPRAAGAERAPRLRLALLTGASLACFAANSLLCRAALGRGRIDPASFTGIRLATGALTLAVLLVAARRARPAGGSTGSAAALFAYAAAFSLAYVRIGAGVGALLLFGAVQTTMLGWSALRGRRPGGLQLVGVAVALAGLAWLVLPGATGVDPVGGGLMLVAGGAWGAYSLRGRTARDPLATTAHNFLLAAPVAVLLGAVLAGLATLTGAGIALAAASGALASGIGYSLWYAALPALGPTRAAAVQLAVPVLAGVGATAFLGEQLTPRVAATALAILAGIALTLRR